MAGPEANYAVRINVGCGGRTGKTATVRFGNNGPKDLNDSIKDCYYDVEEWGDGRLWITRHPWHKHHDGRVRGTGDDRHRVLTFTKLDKVNIISKFVGEYDVFEEGTVGSRKAIIVDIKNRSNFTNMYARKSGQTVDIEDKEKIKEVYNKVLEEGMKPVFKNKPYDPTHLSKIAALSNEDAAKLSKEIIMGNNKVNNDPLTTIDEIMGEQLKELEAKIKKLQAELDPLLEARLRLTRARECLNYNCEIQKGE